jgi:hypothetical protein
MSDVITVLGLAKAVNDLVKEARELAREHKNTDVLEKLLDVQQALGNLMDTVRELKDENAQLRAKNLELQSQNDLSKELKYDAATRCYVLTRDGKQENYCKICWEIDRRLSRSSGPACHYCRVYRPQPKR